MTQNELPSSQRRTFLTVLLAGLGAALAAMTAWPVFRFLSPHDTGGADAKVTLERDKVPVGGAKFIEYHGRPAVVLQPKPGEFVALTAVCTHLGCIVKWVNDKQEFLCPCHGGRFSTSGQVLGGPPPKDLESFNVQLDGDQLVIG